MPEKKRRTRLQRVEWGHTLGLISSSRRALWIWLREAIDSLVEDADEWCWTGGRGDAAQTFEDALDWMSR